VPLPMVHLEVAHALRPKMGPSDPGQFMLGSIAPDAIHMRPGWTREDKRRIHLTQPGDRLSERFVRVDCLRQSLGPVRDHPFALGWVSHVVTDFVWSRYVVHGHFDAYAESLDPKQRRECYYHETDKADFLLYRSASWRAEVWELLSRAAPGPFADLLCGEEIGAWRDRVLSWFGESSREPAEDPKCFTLERVRRLVDLSVRICAKGFEAGFVESIPALPAELA
jgi:hypothetical protein